MAHVTLYGPDNLPLPRRVAPARTRAAMLAGSRDNMPYDAASRFNEHTEAWYPWLLSADTELNTNRDLMVARARDLARNDGWAAGAVTRLLDSAIGASFRPISKPDYRALARYTGNSAFDAMWAEEYGRAVDAAWRDWANDETGKYCDIERTKWMGLLFGVAFRHLLIDNDALATVEWRPDRVAPGRARYATCVRLVDPDRLSNPQMRMDLRNLRGGVEIDDDGAPVAYHIRRAHMTDWFMGADTVTWERVPRETDWGRPMVAHYCEPDRASRHRGGDGIFTPVIQRAKMLFKYDTAELDGAILNAIFAAIAESPFDHELLGEALGEGDVGRVSAYQEERAAFHEERRMMIGGSKVLTAYPGEKFSAIKSERPNANFPFFEKAVLRNMAMGIGSGASMVSGDYSDVNFSSLRAEINEVWKTIHRRRHNFGAGFASPIRSAWLEEAMEVDDLPLPNGAPEYFECRAAYSRCKWMGPGKGWVDPVAEKQGAVLGMDAGLSTLEREASENAGEDWEDVLDQRAIEVAGFKRRGLNVPTWAGMQTALPAQSTIQKPEAV
ncbi:MAG: phage portal protein [Caulobacteraceae bacterium]|nr:phage portal protein [Caulobacteraceae bacterium]